mmetsp:Transcript_6558/g.10840  ORF Transcript_6558/g.10840 Transcript_6558/m.10840 type:complete len:110 (+) Transcript_6558:82-411(+)
MLAHLKAKQREHKMPESADDTAASIPEQQIESSQSASAASSDPENCPTTTMTCEALCSLSYVPAAQMSDSPVHEFDFSPKEKQGKKGMGCPKQHQLPMFLSSKSGARFL